MNFDYTKENLYRAFAEIINVETEAVFVSGNLTNLGKGDFADKKETLETFFSYIKEIAGKDSTVIVPTFSQNLANTDVPFEPKKTLTNLGVFPNYILQKADSIRSFHPFTSFTAVGPKAEFICTNNTRFPYGIDSPYDKILSLKNPLAVSIGLEPRLTCSLIHQVEFNMHVPYRYIKEFNHPVKFSDELRNERFYLHSVYHDINEKRNKNEKFFANFEASNTISKQRLGKSFLYSYKMKDFYDSALELMKKDIYSWLDEEPLSKPYII